jgi:hypothetical protein
MFIKIAYICFSNSFIVSFIGKKEKIKYKKKEEKPAYTNIYVKKKEN